jgi:hypothetical protein
MQRLKFQQEDIPRAGLALGEVSSQLSRPLPSWWEKVATAETPWHCSPHLNPLPSGERNVRNVALKQGADVQGSRGRNNSDRHRSF